jgi:hypothetical protein
MKNEIENLAKKTVADIANKPISRKEAIKKTGYVVASAATMMLLLNSPKAQACSPAPPSPPSGGPRHGGGGRGPWGKGK